MDQVRASGQKTKRPLAGGSLERRAAIGRERREKTRRQLLLSAARLVASRGTEGLTIEDFIKAAGVARGTFYNYFKTREQLIETLWQHVGTTSLSEIARANRNDPDPAFRLVSGLRMSIRKAASDHVWGWLMYRMTSADPHLNEELRSFPMRDIRDGIRLGRFDVEDTEIAADFFVGVAMMSMKAVLIAERPADYPERCALLVLRGLGLGPVEAAEIANRQLLASFP